MMWRSPAAVGFVLVTAVVGLTWFITTTTKDRFGRSSTYPVYADFTDASGIRDKTRVQINGIDVGTIEEISHVRNDKGHLMARVKLRILKDYSLHENATVRKAAESLLGDYRIDLDPGTPEYEKLPEGGVIRHVQSLSDLDEIQSELKQVAKNVNDVTESFSSVLSGPDGEGSIKEILAAVEHSMQAIENTTEVLSQLVAQNNETINRVIENMGQISDDMSEATGAGGDIKAVLENMARLTSRLDNIAQSVETMVAGDPGGYEEASLQGTLGNLNASIGRLSEVARKLDDGQGTLGRLINDPSLHSKVEETVEGANEMLGGLTRMKTELELRSEYNVPFTGDTDQVQAAIKNTLGLRLFPKPDKYYILEAIADPRGRQTRKVVSTTQDETTEKVETVVTSYDKLRFSAQFAKRYYFLTLRFGIIENSGGLGMNLHALNDDLELRLDMYDFDRRDPSDNSTIFPRLRGMAMYEVISHVSLQAGVDDPFNRKFGTWFFGAMLRFTDEDLKSLLLVAPSPG